LVAVAVVAISLAVELNQTHQSVVLLVVRVVVLLMTVTQLRQFLAELEQQTKVSLVEIIRLVVMPLETELVVVELVLLEQMVHLLMAMVVAVFHRQ
jgi:hypothetical protein